MAIRDNGKGIFPEVFRAGGCHGGISRMRLLAQRIGGRLRLFSRAQADTQVELSIPDHIAFASQNGVFAKGDILAVGVRDIAVQGERNDNI